MNLPSGHGVGKTSCLLWVALWWIGTHYHEKVILTAPTSAQRPGHVSVELDYPKTEIERAGAAEIMFVAGWFRACPREWSFRFPVFSVGGCFID